MDIRESQTKSTELETHSSQKTVSEETELQISQSTIVNEASRDSKISEEKPTKLVKVNEVDYDVTEE